MALRTNEIYFKPGALQNAADENVPVLDLLSQCLKIVQQYVPEELDKIINILQQDTEGLVYVNDQIKKGTIYDPYEDGEKHHINFLLDILNISYS
jgi:hypothetical protein